MPEQQGKETQQSRNIQPETNKQEKGPQARSQGVFSPIEDATYAILRKHEKQTVSMERRRPGGCPVRAALAATRARIPPGDPA